MLGLGAALLGLGCCVLGVGVHALLLPTRRRNRPTCVTLSAGLTLIPLLLLVPLWLNWPSITMPKLATQNYFDIRLTTLATIETLWAPSLGAIFIIPLALFSLLTLERGWRQSWLTQSFVVALIITGYFLCSTDSIFIFILSFEILVIITLLLLQTTSKSERVLDAVLELFLWALCGSVCLLSALGFSILTGLSTFSQLSASQPQPTIIIFLLIAGLGIKVPLWPATSWLLRAHVEASVEFSILLSGVLVKAGVIGIIRVITNCPSSLVLSLLLCCAFLGCLEAGIRLIGQCDLKRIVALMTVLEMNWAVFALAWGTPILNQIGIYILIAHSLTTSSEFYLVELFFRRFSTRDITKLSGTYAACPNLWFASFGTILIAIGFPGSSIFVAKVCFCSSILPLTPYIGLLFIVGLFVVTPIILIRIWVPIWFGQSRPQQGLQDLSAQESAICLLLILAGILLGVVPSAVLPRW